PYQHVMHCSVSATGVSTLFFSSLTRRPPSSTLFPYTTLFRSVLRPRQSAGPALEESNREGELQPRPTARAGAPGPRARRARAGTDRKSTRLNSSHLGISYAVFCLKKKIKPTVHHSSTTLISKI